MANRIKGTGGQNYADNILAIQYLFDVGGWSVVTGTGLATLDDTTQFAGDKSLKIENSDTANNLVVTRSSSALTNTIIKNGDGTFKLSWYAKKDIPLEVRSGAILVYKNALQIDTQTFSIGSATASLDINDKWVRFESSEEYDFLEDDQITFQIRLDGVVTAELTTFINIDGFMLNKADRLNRTVPYYNKPSSGELYNLYTGWAVYNDTTYTTGSPFTAVDGVKVDLPNNTGTSIVTQTPIDIDTFYDGTVIKGRNGDGLNITFEFKCRPNGGGANPRITLSIDIGGAIGELYPVDFLLTKGDGVEHRFVKAFDVYTLDTWEINGGTVKILATNEDIEIYDIRYIITRTHKAR